MNNEVFNNIFSVAVTILVYVFGGLDIALQSLLVLMFIDYITGVLSAYYNKKLSSKVGIKGILKKVSYLCIIALSVVIDKLTGQSGVIRTLVIYFFVGNEGLSILENISQMGVKLPKKLLESLEQLTKKGE